jgi:hypothetical protein
MITRYGKILKVLVIGIFLIAVSSWVKAEDREFTEGEKSILREIKIIKLVVNASTWREEVPYNIHPEVKAKLEDVGFEVVNEDSKRKHDALMAVVYKEKKII